MNIICNTEFPSQSWSLICYNKLRTTTFKIVFLSLLFVCYGTEAKEYELQNHISELSREIVFMLTPRTGFTEISVENTDSSQESAFVPIL